MQDPPGGVLRAWMQPQASDETSPQRPLQQSGKQQTADDN
jgi:hypothetical protein